MFVGRKALILSFTSNFSRSIANKDTLLAFFSQNEPDRFCMLLFFGSNRFNRFRGYRVNERRIRASFCPFKNLCGPVLYGVLFCFTFDVDGSD